jgi:hypothetical protein
MGVLDLFVVQKGFNEVYIELAPLNLVFQGNIYCSEVLRREDGNHLLIVVNVVENLRNPSYFGERQEDIG